MTTPPTLRLRRVPLAALAVLIALLGPPALGVECRLAPNGAITTWLLAPAYGLDVDGGFAKDLLPARRGEISGLRRVDGAGGAGSAAWRGAAFNRTFLDLSDRCRERGESVLYLACELRAEKAGTYTLDAMYWSQLRVWLDGKQILDAGGKGSILVSQESAKIKLGADRTYHLLVKLGSRSRQAMLRLALLAPGGEDAEPKAAPVRVVLRVPPARLGDLVTGSLSIWSQGDDLIGANKAAPLSIRVSAGWPLVEGEVRIKAVVHDDKGRTVKTFKDARIQAEDLAGDAVSLAWVSPPAKNVRHYTVKATVLHGAKPIGELSKVLYLAEGLSAWASSLGRRLAKIGDQLGPRRYTDPDYALARLKIEKAVLYERSRDFGTYSREKFVAELKSCGRAVTRVEKHEKRPAVKGLSEHAYLSTVDDSPQPYYVYVPKGHDGRKRLPLIVYLHGYAPDLDKLNWEMIPRDLFHYCDEHGYYLLAPFARSNTDFQGIGEADVLRTLFLVNARYPIHPNRVFLFGYSMGGMGVFTIGAHYPDLWAGIVAASSRADYYLWRDFDPKKVEPYKRHLLDMEFGMEMIGNFRRLPVLMYHGAEDSLVKIEQPRRLLKRLKPLGGDVTLRVLPGEDHWIMNRVLADDAVFRWMNKKKRDPWPAAIDFKTFTPKYGLCYWVRIIETVRWGEPARVRARLNNDKTGLAVTASNVATLRLDLSEHLVGKQPSLVVRINGTEHKVTKPGVQTFEIVKLNRVGPLRKTGRFCGPAKEVYNRRFLMVFGVDPNDKKDVERFRTDYRRAAGEWYRFAKGMPRIQIDAKLTAADVAGANLILYGTPANNAKLKEIAGKLPIKITDRGFEFQGKKYSNTDHGLVMIYPNPLNPKRYVMIRSGLPYGERLSTNHKFDLLPDFVIFKEGVDYDDTDRAVVAGFFDRNWQVAERLIWRRGKDDPDPRLFKPPVFAPDEQPPLKED